MLFVTAYIPDDKFLHENKLGQVLRAWPSVHRFFFIVAFQGHRFDAIFGNTDEVRLKTLIRVNRRPPPKSDKCPN